jgi:protease-4
MLISGGTGRTNPFLIIKNIINRKILWKSTHKAIIKCSQKIKPNQSIRRFIMRFLKANLLSITVVFLLIFSELIPPCSGQTEESSDIPAPPVIAHFHLSGELSESPIEDPFNLMAGQLISLKELVSRMERASTDSDVKAVVLTYDSMNFGFGQLTEIREAINRIKAAGKKVYVHAEGMNIFVYSLLCAGNHISVAPQSSLFFIGIYAETLYVKSLLDKIGVQADFVQMGDYKSAAEMLTRTEPSGPADENVNWLLDGYYESLTEMIARSRGKTTEQIRELIDQGLYIADEALDKGLIDAIETREEFLARLKADFEDNVKIDNRYGRDTKAQINLSNPFALFTILAEIINPPKKPQKDTVAVIYVEGVILPGHSQPSPLGQTGGAFGGDIRKALETAAKDDSVKAVVMRVDSPGGSAEASEVILNATRQVQAKKPLIVSMGDVAGSGGYYISCGADWIFADEVTITASIGVVGGKLITTDMWGKLGVNWVDYKRGANSDMLSSARPFDESQKQLLIDYMQKVYEVFKGHVAKGRGDKLAKDVEEMAGGRIYTGKQALELGLVDEIGGLHEAIEYAAAKVSLEDYDVRIIPRPKDFITQLMEQYSGEGEKPTDITISDATSLFVGHPMFIPILDILRKAEPQRANALYQALQRIELLRSESVILMMPFDLIIR